MTQDEFSAEAIRRVPVAEGVLSSLAVLFSEERMASLYERHRGASYESELSFDSVVKLMYSAVIEHGAVGSAAFKAARSVYCIDGKKLKDVAKRLKETRGVAGKLLGGKALVALSVHEQLVVAMSSSLDGEANDGPLVPELLEKVHAWSTMLNVFLADSQFCDLTTPKRILAYGSDFVMRYHPKVHFHVDPDVKAVKGKDNWGRPYVEEIGWLGKPGTKTSIRVRRITVS